jgi:hypothetical protein
LFTLTDVENASAMPTVARMWKCLVGCRLSYFGGTGPEVFTWY